MSELKVKSLYERVRDTKDPFDRSYILSILYTRIAAGLENMENAPDDVGVSEPSEIWEKANNYLSELVERDSARAFQVGIDLTLLPRALDEHQEKVNRWIRTSGLTVLGLKENTERLDAYLQQGSMKDRLASVLADNIGRDVSLLKTTHDLRDPSGFTTVQSVYIALGLKDGPSEASRKIYQMAQSRAGEEDIKQVAGILKSLPECQYLSERL